MTTLSFETMKLAPQQWTRLGRLVSAYRRDHAPLTQDELADRLSAAVDAAARNAGESAAATQRYTKQDISRIEAWARPEIRRPRRLPRIVETFQLQGLAAVLGMHVADMISFPAGGRMRSYDLGTPGSKPAVLGEALQRHQAAADEAVVWSKHLISMFFPTAALYAYYRANYTEGASAESWVSATEERREAVLGHATTRRWAFAHVLFASDLLNVVKGTGRFASIEPDLRASCLESLRRAATETPNCHIAVVDDLSGDRPAPEIAALKIDVGAYTHVSNMGDGCIVVQDLLGVWHVGEERRDVRAYRLILRDLVEAARYRERPELATYLDSLIQRTLLAYG